MGNLEKGEVSFSALNGDWVLKFSTNAMCEMEDKAGVGAVELANSLQDEAKVKLSTLRLMVWAGLKHHHSDIDLKKSGDIIDALGFGAVGTLIAEAFIHAFPDAEAGDSSSEGKKVATA